MHRSQVTLNNQPTHLCLKFRLRISAESRLLWDQKKNPEFYYQPNRTSNIYITILLSNVYISKYDINMIWKQPTNLLLSLPHLNFSPSIFPLTKVTNEKCSLFYNHSERKPLESKNKLSPLESKSFLRECNKSNKTDSQLFTSNRPENDGFSHSSEGSHNRKKLPGCSSNKPQQINSANKAGENAGLFLAGCPVE